MNQYLTVLIALSCIVQSVGAFDMNENGMITIGQGVYCAVGFGTYPLHDETCYRAVKQAVEAGYSIIDTATFYQNFDGIRPVLAAYDRNKLYIISKVWPNAHTAQQLRSDLQATLTALNTPYLDAYLLHFPNSSVPVQETLSAMKELQQEGLLRHIGLSNVTVNHLKRALSCNVLIACVQIEMHPEFCDFALLDFCKEHDILVQAWAPLGRGRLSSNEFLVELAKKYNKTAAQVALRWIVQHGCIPLPGSQNVDHIQQNKDIFDFALSVEEMNAIDERASNGQRERVSMEAGLGFADEFDFSFEECWPLLS